MRVAKLGKGNFSPYNMLTRINTLKSCNGLYVVASAIYHVYCVGLKTVVCPLDSPVLLNSVLYK